MEEKREGKKEENEESNYDSVTRSESLKVKT